MNMKKNSIVKIFIDYRFQEGPYGGANQFLKSLKQYFESKGVYEENPFEADVILVNHTQVSKGVLELKRKCPEKIIIHRMDGPVSKHRPRAKIIDWHSFFLDKKLCDGTVFQSAWTRDNCMNIGYKRNSNYTIIHNAPNPKIFMKSDEQIKSGDKIKLVTTSWSPNWSKGFDVIQYLDKYLDYNRYEFTFIGRSPIEFQNIISKEPMGSEDLARELRKCDIFIAASRNESCSNSLIEAINCGLVVVARNSGSYPELIGGGGELFETVEECILQIEKVSENLSEYKKKMNFYSIEDVGKEYYQFALKLSNDINSGKISRKQFKGLDKIQWDFSVILMRMYIKCNNIYEKSFLKI